MPDPIHADPFARISYWKDLAEQAEKERDEARWAHKEEQAAHLNDQARLAKVTQLVEALEHVDEVLDRGAPLYPGTGTQSAIKEALAAWGAE